MATLTIMATSQPGLYGTLSWSSLGYMLLTIGVLATLLSGRRYLMGYMAAGMGYWLVIEVLQSIVVTVTSMSSGYGYLSAFILSIVLMASFLAYRYKKQSVTMAQKTGVETLECRGRPVATLAKSGIAQDKYIEHTPIYNNYKPRFRN